MALVSSYRYARYYWLHELRQIRARERVHGTGYRKEKKAAQRELAKARKELRR